MAMIGSVVIRVGFVGIASCVTVGIAAVVALTEADPVELIVQAPDAKGVHHTRPKPKRSRETVCVCVAWPRAMLRFTLLPAWPGEMTSIDWGMPAVPLPVAMMPSWVRPSLSGAPTTCPGAISATPHSTAHAAVAIGQRSRGFTAGRRGC
ncbi:unannotated protein [freshwater metagenome]|uniref:Unannotated protein n=1 Tax=freshwater metagenome TaxID=449393 RepID=A0A6J7PMT1_9ZZZZ